MNPTKTKNPAASVQQRLLNRALEARQDYQLTLTNFLLERFLYRLGLSSLRSRFVLKGALLFRVWADIPYRATLDLDLLRRAAPGREAIAADIRAICATPAPEDAVQFDTSDLTVEDIRAEDEYIAVMALWRQLRVPRGARLDAAIEALRAMTWEEFARALEGRIFRSAFFGVGPRQAFNLLKQQALFKAFIKYT